MMFRTATLAALAATVSIAAPASAQTAPTRLVHYGDLDLSRADAQLELQHRIALAVREVCPTPQLGGTEAIQEYQVCRHRARTSAAIQVAAVLAQSDSDLASR